MGLLKPVGSAIGLGGSLSVDAASYVWTVWTPVAKINQGPVTWRVQAAAATTALLYACFSSSATSTDIFASGAIGDLNHVSGTITANILGKMRFEMRRNVYCNFRIGATSSIRQFWVTESDDASGLG